MESYFLTDTGRVREHNEDSVTILKNVNDEYLLAVADGMGGHNAGDYASRFTVDTMVEEIEKFNKKYAWTYAWCNRGCGIYRVY